MVFNFVVGKYLKKWHWENWNDWELNQNSWTKSDNAGYCPAGGLQIAASYILNAYAPLVNVILHFGSLVQSSETCSPLVTITNILPPSCLLFCVILLSLHISVVQHFPSKNSSRAFKRVLSNTTALLYTPFDSFSGKWLVQTSYLIMDWLQYRQLVVAEQ